MIARLPGLLPCCMVAAGALGLCWSLPARAATAERPNILFILTDDQPYKTVGCYPEAPAWVVTPQIDRLAARGVRFERAYLGSWCMPSRASLLTGRLQHGVETMRMEGTYPGSSYDPEHCPFMPAELRRQGYHTAHIGKWHTGVDGGFGRDWDEQIIWNRPKYPENAGAYFTGQILERNGIRQPGLMEEYSTDYYTDRAVEFIRGDNRPVDRPWYLWLCFGAVHGPTTPADRHRGSLQGRPPEIPTDIFGPRSGKPEYLARLQAWEPGPGGMPRRLRKTRRPDSYDADTPGQSLADWVAQVNECARAIDDSVGRLISALEASGQLANTLVVFTSDQGFALGEHGCSIKLCPYDANIASPLIVTQPGTVAAGRVVDRPVNATDIVATLCERAGISLPWKTHGRSFSRILEPDGGAHDAAPPMLLTSTGRRYGSATARIPPAEQIYEHAGVPWWVMIRHGRYKYIRSLVAGEVEELYDLDADPDELDNLAVEGRDHRPPPAATLAMLRQALADELERTDAPFREVMPPPRLLNEPGP